MLLCQPTRHKSLCTAMFLWFVLFIETIRFTPVFSDSSTPFTSVNERILRSNNVATALDLCLSPAYLCSVISWVKTLILSLVCYISSCLIPFTCHRELSIDMLFPLLRCFMLFSSLCSHDPHIFSPDKRVYKEVCAYNCLNSAN